MIEVEATQRIEGLTGMIERDYLIVWDRKVKISISSPLDLGLKVIQIFYPDTFN